MRSTNTIVINGKVYDAVSGLAAGAPDSIDPVHRLATSRAPQAAHPQTKSVVSDIAVARVTKAKAVHRQTQRSQTLRRDILKAPTPTHRASIRRTPQPGHHSLSPLVSKFAPHPQPITHSPRVVTPHVQAAHSTQAAAHRPAPAQSPATRRAPALSSRELKEKLIAQRLAAIQDTPSAAKEHTKVTRPFFARAPRVSSVVAASFAIVFLGGYLTYINMPSLSMRVAAARAGVNASFPDYRPDGYRFNGPIAYNSGEINLKFASNTSSAGYTINQQNSNWDSQAVLDNYVAKKSNNYQTYSERGLTIYTYDGKAAWVNGGVFYTIEGNAPLSSEQILHIASSM